MQDQTEENDFYNDDDDEQGDDNCLHYDVTLLLQKLFSFPSDQAHI